MRNLRTAFIALVCCSLLACSEGEKLEITFNESAQLSIHVKDAEGTAIVDEGVHLYSVGGDLIDHKRTDEGGRANFGELLSGEYVIILREVESGGVVYRVSQYIQIIAGKDKVLTIIPEEYIGTIHVTITEITYDPDFEENPGANYTILVIPSEDFDSNASLEDLKEVAIVEGTTDSEGLASVDLPANIYMTLVYYPQDESNRQEYNNIYLEKGDEEDLDLELSFNSLTVTMSDYSTSQPTAGVDIMVVKYNDYYSNSNNFNALQDLAVADATTGADGTVNFTLIDGSYAIIQYTNENHFRHLNDVGLNGGVSRELSGYVYGLEGYVYDYSSSPYQGVKVAVITSTYYGSLTNAERNNLDALIEGSIGTIQTTGSSGIANFSGLFNNEYYVVAYESDKSEWAIEYEYVSNSSESVTFYLDASN